jgi:predicted Holliday junction resolvase-like endonuclease
MTLNVLSLLILVICIIYIVFIWQQLFEIYVKEIIEEYLNRNKEMEKRAKIEENKMNKKREEEEIRIKDLIEKYINKHFEESNKENNNQDEE